MKRVCVDFETSGLTPGTHAPVTLGVAVMDGATVIDSREWLFAPPTYKDKISRAYDVVALEISGASWVKIKREGVPHNQVCRELLAFTREHEATFAPVVAFNAAFDLAWYSDLLFLGGSWNQELRAYQPFLPPLAGPWECAMLRAKHALPGLASYSLDAVCSEVGLSREGDKHGALEDAILAGQIISALDGLAKERAA